MINCELYIGDVVFCGYEGGFFRGVIAGVVSEDWQQIHTKAYLDILSDSDKIRNQKDRDKNIKYIVHIYKIGGSEKPAVQIDRMNIFLSIREFLDRIKD